MKGTLSRSCRTVAALLLVLGLAMAGLPAGARKEGGAVLLVSEGKPATAIVVPPRAGVDERRAAEILRSSVERMSGAVLPIRERRRPGGGNQIAIGFAGRALPRELRGATGSLKEDGFLVATAGGSLHVVSGGHKGSIYGVVHVLETYFGCRRYSPTASRFPKRDTLRLGPLFESENPATSFRAVHGEFARDTDYRDWQRLDLTEEVFGAGYYVHTFERLVPWQTWFEAHPEYYAWMNGKRIKDQLCPSRPEVLELAVEKLRKEMAAQPDRKVWSVSQNDNPSYCRCDRCSKVIEEEGGPSGPILRLVNAVAARFPDKIISTLAYDYSRQAPRRTRPAANVQIMLCTIEVDRSRPIAESASGRAFARDLEDWRRISGNVYLWDYTVNFSHCVSPFPNLHVLQPNVRLFAGSGVRQIFEQTNTSPGHELSELKSYLLARLLWNPDADAAATIGEFLDGYYGPAAPYIGRYIAAIEEALVRSGEGLHLYEPPVAHSESYLSQATVAKCDDLFDRAEAAVEGDRVLLDRVEAARLALQYAVLEIGKDDLFGPRGFHVDRGGRFEPRREMERRLDDFCATCDRVGVTSLNEAGLTPAAYCAATRRFLEAQVEGNLAFRKGVVADPPPAAKYGRGDLRKLTDGVRGANDFRVHWLGWEGADFDLTVDLGASTVAPRQASISTLYDPKSWILHPRRVTCLISTDGVSFREVRSLSVEGDQRSEEMIRTFVFDLAAPDVRSVRFHVEGTMELPRWHPSAGGTTWVFVDEIVVR